MDKVNFIIIGAQKCGTTSLAELLSSHPAISFSKIKEPAFFNKRDWKEHLKEYHTLYENLDSKCAGEASTMYSFYPEFLECAKNIHAYNPEMKLIYLIKDPIKRIESHFAHRKVRGRENQNIEDAVIKNPNYINTSKYYEQISRYREFFPDSQIKIILFENLIEHFQSEMKAICNFLEISSAVFNSKNELPNKNKSVGALYLTDKGRRIMNSSLVQILPYRIKKRIKTMYSSSIESKDLLPINIKAKVQSELLSDIEKMEEYIGKDLSAWKNINN